MVICKFCGEKIEWACVGPGKYLSVVSEEVNYEDLEEGQELITWGGVVYKKRPNTNFPNVGGRLVHRCRAINFEGMDK